MSQVAQPGTNANPVNIGEVSNTPLPESPSTAQLGILGNIFGVGSAVTNGALSSLDVYPEDLGLLGQAGADPFGDAGILLSGTQYGADIASGNYSGAANTAGSFAGTLAGAETGAELLGAASSIFGPEAIPFGAVDRRSRWWGGWRAFG